SFHAHWPEAPSGKIYGETANADGQAAFEAQKNRPFDRLLQQGVILHHGEEESPYGFTLGITYPVSSAEHLMRQAHEAMRSWSKLPVRERAAVLIECLEDASKHFFEIGYATQHTTGQGFVMSFQASGPHSFDRALEAVATGVHALESFVTKQEWTKPMGKMNVVLDKRYHVRPKGVNVTIGCSTFPVWNTLPGMFASLITGAATIAKAHTKVVYPIAIVVASMQHTLARLGLDPHLVQLACGAHEHRITHDLLESPVLGTVDYTGSSQFGDEVEAICARTKVTCFTEKAGVNTILLGSAANLDAALDNIAFSLSLYSGQMCTAPQNIFIPENGVSDGDAQVSFDDVCSRLATKVRDIAHNEKMGPTTLGALQNPHTKDRLEAASALSVQVILPSERIAQPGFDHARTYSPLILKAGVEQTDIYETEWFGPIAFVIPVRDFAHGIERMTQIVRTHGALTSACYTTDAAQQQEAEAALIDAGVPVAFNFTGPIWINQSAAFSDFHGTGANAAGNASYADLTFVTARYNVIGARVCA
ncbi:MAG: aldehyde dehydrogenase family protein, partial [Candidatus Kapaibacterium sp.]